MTVCSTTALRKYLTQHSNLGQPSREKAVSTTRAHAEGETIINSGRYRRPLFKSSQGKGSRMRRGVPPGGLCCPQVNSADNRAPHRTMSNRSFLYRIFGAFGLLVL